MRQKTFFALAIVAGVLSPFAAYAHDGIEIKGDGTTTQTTTGRVDSHAPIGVMGDHMHKRGEWMLSYRAMRMDMSGNQIGDSNVSAATIATTVPNRFFGAAGQPATLRVVPTEMTMDMQMLGAMYAPTDWLTLMAMAQYVEKDMDHTTFSGGAGTAVLGTFSTDNEGWGDTRIGGLIRLYENKTHRLHLNMGLSIPTGSLDAMATVLAPSGATPRLRMPYAMQLGTGTYDLLPGLTYTGYQGAWGWGAQYAAEIRLQDENDEGYAWGDKHSLSAWGSYTWAPWISTSLRLTGTSQAQIDGIDPQIVAPVQTADPDNYGGETVTLGLGVNLLGQRGTFRDHRLALEASVPVYQKLNGPQMATDWTLMLGWQKAF